MSLKHIVIAGGGFGGVYTYKYIHRFSHGRKDIQVTLVSKTNYFLFTPLLHEVATGGLVRENIVEPIRDILRCCSDSFCLADVTGLSTQSKTLLTTAGPLSYDVCVLALGAETNFFGTKGASEHCFQLKNLSDAVSLKNHLIRSFEKASRCSDTEERKRLLRIVVIGGGPTGVELACEISDFLYATLARYYLKDHIEKDIHVVLVQRGNELVPQFHPGLRRKCLELLRRKRVDVRLLSPVVDVSEEGVALASGEVLETRCPVWVAGVTPIQITLDAKNVADPCGRLLVDDSLRLQGYSDVFVLGDAATCGTDGKRQPYPQLAQVAVLQAPVVAANILRSIEGKPLKPFSCRLTGTLISLGEWCAAGEIFGIVFSGRFAWWLWRTVYLSKLLSFRKKAEVAIDWTFDLFLPRDISELD